jgi:hypothetical protein
VGESGRRIEGVRPAVVNRGGGALERPGEGEGWHGSRILGVLYIGQGDEVRGRGRKSSSRRWELGRRLFMVPLEGENES